MKMVGHVGSGSPLLTINCLPCLIPPKPFKRVAPVRIAILQTERRRIQRGNFLSYFIRRSAVLSIGGEEHCFGREGRCSWTTRAKNHWISVLEAAGRAVGFHRGWKEESRYLRGQILHGGGT